MQLGNPNILTHSFSSSSEQYSYALGARDFRRSHTCMDNLAGEICMLWRNNSFFSTYQGRNTPGSSITEGLNTWILQAPELTVIIYADSQHGLQSYLPPEGLIKVLLSPGPGAIAHWAVLHHLLDHRQENLTSIRPDIAESWYDFSPLPSPNEDKRSFRPKGTGPHWLQVTWIQLLGCTPGQEPKHFLAGLQATAIWESRNNSAVKKLINQAESCLAALNFPPAIC